MGFDGKNVATTDTNHATMGVEMRAIVQDSYGSAEVLRSAQIDRPRIAEHEVLLRAVSYTHLTLPTKRIV